VTVLDTPSGVVDLRQYTLLPNQRDALIDLFDSYFVDGQEDVDIHVIGQFRDLDDPDRFVWLRGFESMPARGTTLPRFYQSPVWRAHSEAANATMSDTDNALLLKPTYLGPAYPHPGSARPNQPIDSLIAIMVAHLIGPITAADRDLADTIRAELAATDAEVVATFATHAAENNYLSLPVRDEHVLAWVTRFPNDTAYDQHQDHLAHAPGWAAALTRLANRSSGLPTQQLRLRPTDRSQLR
jgi:hypothetical protein